MTKLVVSTTLQLWVTVAASCLPLISVFCYTNQLVEAVTAASSAATHHRGIIGSSAGLSFVPFKRLRVSNCNVKSNVLLRGGAIEIDDNKVEISLDGDEYEFDEDSVDEVDNDESDEYEDEGEEEETVEAASWNDERDVKVESAMRVYDEPLVQSSFHQMGLTFGVMLLCKKLDFNSSKIVKMARFAFITYLIVLQVFLAYVRIQARTINDRTPVTTTNNPLSLLLQEKGGGGAQDAAKHMASSLLNVQSTVYEHDLKQVKSMGNAMLFSMAMLWFLHFKMKQVQPLFFQTATGVLNLVYSPLFQVYVLGRNLERPFKIDAKKANNNNTAAKLTKTLQEQTSAASQKEKNVFRTVQPNDSSAAKDEPEETDTAESESSQYETNSDEE